MLDLDATDARRFKDFLWTTHDSWTRERRVIAKAEWTSAKENPRFVVTSLKRSKASARFLYEKLYCARGDMENRIKECQTDMFADRTPACTMRTNQLRLWFASMASVFMCAFRRIGLAGTEMAEATCGTIRLKLLSERPSPKSTGGTRARRGVTAASLHLRGDACIEAIEIGRSADEDPSCTECCAGRLSLWTTPNQSRAHNLDLPVLSGF